MKRYFRIPDDKTYESLRRRLDEAWGHPTPDGRTLTCVTPAADAPRDSAGRILLAVPTRFCAFEVVAAMLPDLLASGAVEEITAAEYQPAE